VGVWDWELNPESCICQESALLLNSLSLSDFLNYKADHVTCQLETLTMAFLALIQFKFLNTSYKALVPLSLSLNPSVSLFSLLTSTILFFK
jgi:hypothetical protein